MKFSFYFFFLDKLGYTYSFGNSQFSLYLNSIIVGTSLYQDLTIFICLI